MRPGLSRLGAPGTSPRAKTVTAYVPLATGPIFTLPRYGLLEPVTFGNAGGNANLTFDTSTGVVSATAALAAGALQTKTGTVTGADGVSFPWTANLTGAISVPAQVGTVTSTAGNGQVALAWYAPANGGSAITDYLVEYKLSASGTWLTFSDGTSSSTGCTVTGLVNDSAYDFRVSAINVVGPGTASATATATPSLTVTVYRTIDYLMYGSSTYGSTGNGATADGRGNVVPVGSRGIVLPTQIASLIPTTTGKVVSNVTVPQYVGNANSSAEDVRRKVIVDRDAGTLTGKGMICGTPNMWTAAATIEQPVAPETTRDTANQLVASIEALDGVNIPRFCMYTFQIHSSYGNFYSAIKIRLEKASKERGPRLKSGFSSFDEAYVRELPAQAVQDDINAQAARYRGMGWTNGADYAHSNGEAYKAYANYTKLPISTFEGGLPFISPWHYHAYMPAAGKIATVITMGELLGCTFTISDPLNYSLLLVDNPSYPGTDQPQKILELYLTSAGAGARPIKAPHELSITVSKSGYGSETFRISVAIQRRNPADNTPQKVVLRQTGLWFNGYEDDLAKPYFPDTRQFTMFMIVRMDPFDGNQIQFTESGAGVGYLTANPTAGTSDSYGTIYFLNLDKAPGTPTFSIRRTGTNNINVVALDTTGATCFNVTTTGTLTEAHGWRMLSIHYDADQPAKCKVRLGEGRYVSGASVGQDYAAQTTAITPGGTGTLGLGAFRTSPSSYSQMRLLQSSTVLPSMFFPCSIWRWIMTPHFIEDTAPNLAALWQPGRQTGPVAPAALALPGGGSTLDGVDFMLDLRGDAAEWCSGCDAIARSDEENGAKKVKNFGTGPGLNITTPRAVEFEP